MRDPGNLARGVCEDVSSISMVRPRKYEPVTEIICICATAVVTYNSEYLTGKMPGGRPIADDICT